MWQAEAYTATAAYSAAATTATVTTDQEPSTCHRANPVYVLTGRADPLTLLLSFHPPRRCHGGHAAPSAALRRPPGRPRWQSRRRKLRPSATSPPSSLLLLLLLLQCWPAVQQATGLDKALESTTAAPCTASAAG